MKKRYWASGFIVILVAAIVGCFQGFGITQAQLLDNDQMSSKIGSAPCCKGGPTSGEDCQKCISDFDEMISWRYSAGGVARACVEGPPDGCTMTGTFSCGEPVEPSGIPWYQWKLYPLNPWCADPGYVTGGAFHRTISDAVGEECAPEE